MELEKLNGEFTVCKITSCRDFGDDMDFCFMSRTDHELSLVCPSEKVPAHTEARKDGWCGFRVKGTLDFSLTGILARLTGILADHEIPVFAVSTFDTDYIFVNRDHFEKALALLSAAGYGISG